MKMELSAMELEVLAYEETVAILERYGLGVVDQQKDAGFFPVNIPSDVDDKKFCTMVEQILKKKGYDAVIKFGYVDIRR